MNREMLCEKLKDTTYLINVFQDDEIVSSGTGVAINERGDLITAAHVISGRLPIQERDLQNITIQGRHEGNPFDYYGIIECGISMRFEHLKDPITIDLALLKNTNPGSGKPFLPMTRTQPKAGQEILMSGYSDEIDMPFAINKNLNYSHPDLRGHQEEIDKAMELWMRLSMVKSGMIGRVSPFTINDGLLTGVTMYIDNVMHSGASGGPVINQDGELVGIITQRAVTSFSDEENPGLKLPSGSAIAISPFPILDLFANKYGKEFNDYFDAK